MNLDVRKPCRFAFPLGVAAVIWLSLAGPDHIPNPGTWDKLNHTLAYLVIGTAGFLGYPTRRGLIAVAVGLFLLGGGLELIQTQLPKRYGSLADVVANTVGLGLALFGARLAEVWLKPPRDKASP